MTEERIDENIIYVGSKPAMNYVLAVVTQFKSSGIDEVVIKARGRAINRALDAVEIVRNRFETDAKVKEIKIGTEVITNEKEGEIGKTANL